MEQSSLLTTSQSDAKKNVVEEHGNETEKFPYSLNPAIHSSQDSNDVAKNITASEGNSFIKDENKIVTAYDDTLTGGGDASVPYNLEYPDQPLEPITEEPKKRKREEDYCGDSFDCLDCCFLVNHRPGGNAFCLCCSCDEGDRPSNGDVGTNVDAHGNSGDCCGNGHGNGQGDDCDCCDCGDGCDCCGCDGECTII